MTDNLRGIAAILASAAGFVVNDATVKILTDELPTGELIVIRGLMTTIMVGAACWWFGALRPASVLLRGPTLIRIGSAALATLFIVAALRYSPLATVTAVLQVTPLAVTAGSAVLLRSPVGWRRWTASLIGLAGVLLIVRPGAAGVTVYICIALVALLFTTIRDLTTRFIDRSVPSLYVTLGSSIAIMLAGFALMPIEDWLVPSVRALLLLFGASVAVVFAYYLGIVAMRTGEIAVVAPFRYASILLALLLGYMIWGYVPDWTSLFGMFVVCTAGLYLIARERAAMSAHKRASLSTVNRAIR